MSGVKIFDTLLGRTKPVKANLDALFSLPSAAVTLQVSAGLVSTGKAGVCFKPPSGQPFAEVQAEIEQLLRLPDDDGTSTAPGASGTGAPGSPAPTAGEPSSTGATTAHVHDLADSFGYRWIVVEGSEIDDLVTRVHVVHSSLEEAGWGTQLLCSVFGFASIMPGPDDQVGSYETQQALPAGTKSNLFIVYLAKQGTFYPFAPTGKEQRDTELELRIRSTLGSDLPVEQDLSRWFPLWDMPVS
jgi:hypothetical protein